MADEGIIRNRLKIEATISNAEAYLELKKTGTLAAFLWNALGKRPHRRRVAPSGRVFRL